ncbi:MAG: hypothetical protein KA436_07260 [Oligoflexales bacterium]|nr:hypothetical protein [Oligoflexales bacterium]
MTRIKILILMMVFSLALFLSCCFLNHRELLASDEVSSTQALEKKELSRSIFKIKTGKCTLEEGESPESSPEILVCLEAQAGFHLGFITNRSLSLTEASTVRSSVFTKKGISFHIETYQDWAKDYPPKHEIDFLNKELKLAAIRFGDPSSDKFLLTLGQQMSAFGIDKNPFLLFTSFYDNRFFWGISRPALKVSLDDLEKWTWELQVSQNKFSLQDTAQHSFSSRLSRDISIFNGTRFAVSFLSEKEGKRQIGLSAVSTTPDHNLAHIEWIHVRATPDGKEKPFEQIIRLAYEESIKKKTRSLVLYDDVRFQYRLFGFGVEHRFHPQVYSQHALFYRKDESPKKLHRWTFEFGFGLTL